MTVFTAQLKTVSPLERVYSYTDSVDVIILITVFIPLADHEPSKDRYEQFEKSPYLLFFSTQIVQCTSPSLYGPGQLADKVATLHIKYSQPHLSFFTVQCSRSSFILPWVHSSLVDYLAQVMYAKNCPTTFYCIFQLLWVPMSTTQSIRVCFLSS